MSWTFYLYVELDGHKIEVPNTWINYTNNCNGMIRQAGFDEWPHLPSNVTAKELGEKLQLAYKNLLNNPETYKPMNPANGWGSYETLLPVLMTVVGNCLKYPSAKVCISA